MAQIDSPFKMLISTFSEAFAEWLLGSPPQQGATAQRGVAGLSHG